MSLGWTALSQGRPLSSFMGVGKLGGLMQELVAHGGDPTTAAAIHRQRHEAEPEGRNGDKSNDCGPHHKGGPSWSCADHLGTVVSLAASLYGRGCNGRTGGSVSSARGTMVAPIVGLRPPKDLRAQLLRKCACCALPKARLLDHVVYEYRRVTDQKPMNGKGNV